MSRRNPYKLFDYYTEKDAGVFFGRETEVSAVVGDILANKLLVLFARSGSGKTSLLNAGIGPALRELGRVDERDPGIRMVTIRLSGGVAPEESALRTLRTALGEPMEPGETLHGFLRRLCTIPKLDPAQNQSAPSKPPLGLVLVFDQFEELFISLFRDYPDTRGHFAKTLAEVIRDETLRAYVVLSLRSDHFQHLNEFRSVIPNIFQNNTNLELRPFDREAALRVIRGPSKREGSGFSWESGLPERIVGDLEALSDEKERVFPIHLQIVCYDLFERLKDSEHTITLAHYQGAAEAAGGANHKSPAEAMIHQRIIAPLEAVGGRSRRRWLYRLLRELMTAQGAKFQRSLAELRGVIPKRHLIPLLKHLRRRMLVRRIGKKPETYYELRHDYLARTIAPWLEARERELRKGDRRRRAAATTAAAVMAALFTKLLIDCYTYTAYLGGKQRPDELLLERKPAFGVFSPGWWKREISTGYARQQLLAAGLRNHVFPVSRALSDWKDIGDQLNQRERWALQLATRLEKKAKKASPSNTTDHATPGTTDDATSGMTDDATLFEAIQHPDIDLFVVVDRRILDHVLNGLDSGDPKATRSAAETLATVGGKLPEEPTATVVQALFAALKDPRSDARRSEAALALGTLGKKLPPGQIPAVVEALLTALSDASPRVKSAAIIGLAGLKGSIPPKQIAVVVPGVANALKDPDSEVKSAAAQALNIFGRNPPKEWIDPLLDALLSAIRDPAADIRGTAVLRLSALGKTLPEERAASVAAALLTAIEDQNSDIKGAAASALGGFGDKFPKVEFVASLITALVEDSDSNVKSSAADALGSLGRNIPEERITAVVEALVTGLKDPSARVRSSAAEALDNVQAKLPPERITTFFQALLPALKDPNSYVKSRAAEGLGSLGGKLSQEQTASVIAELITLLKDPNSSVKSSAAKALGQLGETLSQERWITTFLDALLTTLVDPAPDVRSSGAKALGRLGGGLSRERISGVVGALIYTLKGPNLNATSDATDALGSLGKKLPPERMAVLVEALLTALKHENGNVRSSAAEALGNFGQNLPSEWVSPVLGGLTIALKDSNSSVKSSAVSALSALSETLPPNNIVPVTRALLAALAEPDSELTTVAAKALGGLGAILPQDEIEAVVAALVTALKDPDSDVKSAVVEALGSLGESIPQARITAFVVPLLTALQDSNSDVKGSAAEIVSGLRELPQEQIAPFVDLLLNALKDPDPNLKSTAAKALGSLGERLPQDRAQAVTTALLTALTDSDSDVKSSAAKALGDLNKKLPRERVADIADSLLSALKDSNAEVKSSAAAALGSLGQALPPERVAHVVRGLVDQLHDAVVKGSIVAALGNLGEGLPQDSIASVIDALRLALKDRDSEIKGAAAEALAVTAARAASNGAPSVFLDLDLLWTSETEADLGGTEKSQVLRALRTLTSANWKQSDLDLVRCLESDDSRWRLFALHVLARREQIAPEARDQILVWRDDPHGRPWVKLTALRCLVEIEREKSTRQAEKEREAAKAAPERSPQAP